MRLRPCGGPLCLPAPGRSRPSRRRPGSTGCRRTWWSSGSGRCARRVHDLVWRVRQLTGPVHLRGPPGLTAMTRESQPPIKRGKRARMGACPGPAPFCPAPPAVSSRGKRFRGSRMTEVYQNRSPGGACHPPLISKPAWPNHPAADGEAIRVEAASIAAPQVAADASVDHTNGTSFSTNHCRNWACAHSFSCSSGFLPGVGVRGPMFPI